MSRKSRPADSKAKVPGWMVSFGDMMTLILTFFILLVSMSRERQVGLIASGIGSFMVSVQSMGLSGALDDQQELQIHNEVRTRFNLPPVESMEEIVNAKDAETREVLRVDDIHTMTPVDELFQPAIAVFEPGRAELTPAAQRYLELLAPSLRPGPGQLLVLETTGGEQTQLGKSRAQAVENHLVERVGFDPARVEVRLWLARPGESGASAEAVDARLVLPQSKKAR